MSFEKGLGAKTQKRGQKLRSPAASHWAEENSFRFAVGGSKSPVEFARQNRL
jgi:hypothetical protein